MNEVQESKDYLVKEDEFYQKARKKAKTNLLYISLFTIVMFFGGLTSAFIVSRGAGFWVSLQIPQSLVYSTIVILISSITMILAHRAIKQNNNSATTLFLALTLVLGLLFGYFQYKGWGEIYQKGYAFTGTRILNPENSEEIMIDGEYGKDYFLFYGGKELSRENGQYFYYGKKMTPIDSEEYAEFQSNPPEMFLGNEFLEVQKTQEKNKQGKEKTKYLAVTKARYNLTENQQAELADQKINSASYFYVLTVAHLLHVLGALLYIIALIVNTLRGKYNENEYLGIKLGGYFWHFLGVLWVYLFLFLYFIH